MVQTAVLVIDVQKGFEQYDATISNPKYKENIPKVLKQFRDQGALIINIQHLSRSKESLFHPSKPTSEFLEFARPLPGEIVITKDVNSAFIGTKLEQILRDRDIRKLYAIGLTIDQCVSTTVRMASNLDICDRNGEKGEIFLIGDACATYGYGGLDSKTIHQVHEATLGHEFCKVIQTADLVA